MGNFNLPKSVEKQPRMLDLFSKEMEAKLLAEGKVYRRKIEPVRDVEEVKESKAIETRLPDDTLESSVEAKPGDYIVTGAKGEKFVFTSKKVNDLYIPDGSGGYLPRERRIIAMANSLGGTIRISAPWGTPEKPEYQEGSEKCFLVVSLDEDGKMTDDRYIIGDKELLFSNYDPV